MKVGQIHRLGILLCLLLLAAGLGLHVYVAVLSVSNYPLATDWSEGWRIFEAASVYGRLVFDESNQLPWQDPARATLEGLVFLVPGSEIWMFRLWKALLLFSTSILIAYYSYKAARKNQVSGTRVGRLLPALIVGWGVVFLLQPPITHHVLLGILAVLIFFDSSKPIRTTIVIILASAWEGLGRINWFLMPALVASTLYFLQVPIQGKKLYGYFLKPFLWCLAGVVVSLLLYSFHLQVNGYISTIFNPSMEYHYFSFKLWPNAGYDLGLIPGMLLLSLPLGLLILWGTWKKGKSIHWLRLVAMVAILVILFIGSTLVSLRSGGGFDLHNYDTFILTLFLVGLFFGMDAVSMEADLSVRETRLLGQPFVLSLLLLVPLYFLVRDLPRRVVLDEDKATTSISELNTMLHNSASQAKPVLFISQRQLLVYGLVDVQEIFYPYENSIFNGNGDGKLCALSGGVQRGYQRSEVLLYCFGPTQHMGSGRSHALGL